MGRRQMLPLAVALAAAACAADDRDDDSLSNDTTDVVVGAGDTPFRAGAALDEALRDHGRGILHFTRPNSVSGVREDSVVIRETPSADGPILARWIHRYGGGAWEFRLETAETGLGRGDIEWTYEESGLPIDSVLPDRSWARVVYGATADNAPRTGWARLGDRVLVENWDVILPQQNLFFRPPENLAFHDSPGGAPVELEIARGDTPDGLDYGMRPLRIQGDWMQVAVTTPSNYCFDPPEVRTDTVWIRYLDDRKRPRVWFYTRGC